MNSTVMKAELAAYWRFVRQSPIVALEAMHEDCLVVSPAGRLIIVEIKVTASDMRADLRKPKHELIRTHLNLPLFCGQQTRSHWGNLFPTAFYFAVPDELADKACEIRNELYPYAGIIVVKEGNVNFRGHLVLVTHKAQQIHTGKLKPHALGRIVKAQSASLANCYSKLARKVGPFRVTR